MTVKAPISGRVGLNGMGIISPDGQLFPINYSVHSQWIINNYEWLTKTRHVDLPDLNVVKDMDVSDARNLLVNQGWIPFFGTKMLTVYFKDLLKASKLILEAMQMRQIPRVSVFMANESGEEQEFNYKDLEEYVEKYASSKSHIKISSRDIMTKNLITLEQSDVKKLSNEIATQILKLVNSPNWKVIVGLGRDYIVAKNIPIIKVDGTSITITIKVNFKSAKYANKMNDCVLGGGWQEGDRVLTLYMNKDRELYDNQEKMGETGRLYTQVVDTLSHELIHSRQHKGSEHYITPEDDRIGYQSQISEIQAFAPGIIKNIEQMLKRYNTRVEEGHHLQTYIEDNFPDFNELYEPSRRYLLNLVYVQLQKDGYTK
jgi:hypothetical protein